MKLVRTVPPLGTWPALLIFHCPSCRYAEMKEDRPA
jgi:hypothetical protein